ncbi:MAG: class I SAM-dependent methyltransferase [Halanaeroarchaeum sp.]
MTKHVIDPESASKLQDVSRYRYLSRDELLASLDPDPEATVIDLGSGTGFYTRDVAPWVGFVYAVDLQPAMHEAFAENGVPENVELVTAGVSDLPLDDDAVDAAVSTMTFHEFVGEAALSELRRVMAPGARLVVVDWSADGRGERGPPLDGRYGPGGASDRLEAAGFEAERVEGRLETFVVTAVSP